MLVRSSAFSAFIFKILQFLATQAEKANQEFLLDSIFIASFNPEFFVDTSQYIKQKEMSAKSSRIGKKPTKT